MPAIHHFEYRSARLLLERYPAGRRGEREALAAAVHDTDWATHAEARAAVGQYLDIFYNTQRRHSVLGYVSPVAFERQHEETLAA